MSEVSLRAYLATALTGLSEPERTEVFAFSDQIGGICERLGLSLYRPKDHTDPVTHAKKPPREVYLTDRERVATSDVVIALCTHPSYGVGAENEIAAAAGVPVIYLVRSGSTISKMLSGSLGENCVVEFTDSLDLEQQLSAALMHLFPRLSQSRKRFSSFDGKAFGARLRDLRERSGLTFDELAAKTGISLGRLESFETQDERISLPTLGELRKLSEALGAPGGYLLGESPLPNDRTAYQSIQALKDFAMNRRIPYPVYDALRTEYLQSRRTIGFATRTRDSVVLTEEHWTKRYEQFLERGKQRNLDLWE